MTDRPDSPRSVARRVVVDESAALARLAESLGDSFDAAVNALLEPGRQIIVSGLGKSGVIAQKIAATLTSTGAPALYLHPVEALHGDLGVVTQRHALVALSRSGNTEEVVRFVAHFRRLGGPVIGVTQGAKSRLAELSHHPLIMPDLPEAGPLALAPTTSCIMQLAVGDAIAMALLHARGLKPEDFAQYHPEGTLGRRLLLRAGDLMHGGDQLPLAPATDSFKHLLQVVTEKQLGLAVLVEPDGRLIGTFTDGDLRRLLSRSENPLTLDARTAWSLSRRPGNAPAVKRSTVAAGDLAVECLALMRESQITSLIVIDGQQRPVGVLRMVDLVAAGL